MTFRVIVTAAAFTFAYCHEEVPENDELTMIKRSSSSSNFEVDTSGEAASVPDLASDLFRQAQASESTYAWNRAQEKRYEDKYRNAMLKHNTLRYNARSLVKRLTGTCAWDGRHEKKKAWKAVIDTFSKDRLKKKDIVKKYTAKVRHYHEATSRGLSSGNANQLPDLYYKLGKYQSRLDTLEDRDPERAYDNLYRYDQEAERRAQESKPIRKSKSLEKARFWVSEAAEMEDVRDFQKKALQTNSLNEYLRQDGKRGRLEQADNRPATSTSPTGVRPMHEYLAKANRYEMQRKHFQEATAASKGEADLKWLMYNAIKYHVPRFANRAAEKMEELGDERNADHWYGMARKSEQKAYNVPDSPHWERFIEENSGYDHRESLESEVAMRRLHEASRKKEACDSRNASQALAVADEHKKESRKRERLGQDSKHDRRQVGGWMTKAEDFEQQRMDDMANNMRAAWFSADNSYVSDVLASRGDEAHLQ